ncbi:hypothetical protein [Paraburkholderia tropica]|uniref:hypothetical protein n=1 Tax=Paraburkholderia tropica TaxID=92647 RepID=UPI003D296B1A
MNIIGKTYQHRENTHEDNDGNCPLKNISNKLGKNIIGLGIGVALFYASFKHGFPTVSHLYNVLGAAPEAFKDHLFTIGEFGFLSYAGATTIEYMRDDYDFRISNVAAFGSIVPITLAAIFAYNEPNSTQYFLNLSQAYAKIFGESLLAIGSTAGLVSPIFAGKLGNLACAAASKLKAFGYLTEKFSDYLTLRKVNQATRNNARLSTNEIYESNASPQDVSEAILRKTMDMHQTLTKILTKISININLIPNQFPSLI